MADPGMKGMLTQSMGKTKEEVGHPSRRIRVGLGVPVVVGNQSLVPVAVVVERNERKRTRI